MRKSSKAAFSQWKSNSFTLYFYTFYINYVHILLIHHCILLSKEILFVSKITSQNTKMHLNSWKNFCLWQAKILAALGMFIAKWISNNNLNTSIALEPDFSYSEKIRQSNLFCLSASNLKISRCSWKMVEFSWKNDIASS